MYRNLSKRYAVGIKIRNFDEFHLAINGVFFCNKPRLKCLSKDPLAVFNVYERANTPQTVDML